MSFVLKMCRAALNLQCLAHMQSIILPADTRKDKDSFYTVQSSLKHWCRSKSGRTGRIKEGKMCKRKAIRVRRHPRLTTTTTSSLRRDQSVRCTQIEPTSWKIHRNCFTIKQIFCTVHKNVSTEPAKYNSAFFFKRPSLFRAIQNVRTRAKRFHPNPHLNSWTKYCGYLPWNQSLQASHSIINWFTS